MPPPPTSAFASKPCHIPPPDKKRLGQQVGHALLEKHGKRRFYSPAQVRDTLLDLGMSIDWHCWAYALFLSPGDFRVLHDAAGEACDQAAMKAEMADALTDGASASWFDVDLSWIDWPDIDFTALFDWT